MVDLEILGASGLPLTKIVTAKSAGKPNRLGSH
jgi:hypothetical protein